MRDLKWLLFSISIVVSGCAPVGSLPGDSQNQSSQSQNPPVTPPPPQPPTGVLITPPRPSNAANIPVCPGAQTITGTDVGDGDTNTSWGSFKNAGHVFTIIKATEGITFVNPNFTIDWTTSKVNGVLRGAYHFFHPGDDPISAADEYLKIVGPLGQDDLPPVLDWETTDGLSASKQIAAAKAWLAAIEAATGRTPMIYVGWPFWNALGNPQGFEKYPLFESEYQVSCPKVPPPWSTFTIWQASDTSTMTGLTQKGHEDYDIFDGTLSDLLQL